MFFGYVVLPVRSMLPLSTLGGHLSSFLRPHAPPQPPICHLLFPTHESRYWLVVFEVGTTCCPTITSYKT